MFVMFITSLQTFWIRRNFFFGVTLLSALLITLMFSFIPEAYTARAIITLYSEQPVDNETFDEQRIIITSRDNIDKIIHQENLLKRSAFIREYPNRFYSILEKYSYDVLRIVAPDPRPINNRMDSIYYQIIDHLKFNNTEESIIIEFECRNPYVARDVLQAIAQQYIQTIDGRFDKVLTQSPQLPEHVSAPNIPQAIYCIATLSILLGIVSTLVIKPAET